MLAYGWVWGDPDAICFVTDTARNWQPTRRRPAGILADLKCSEDASMADGWNPWPSAHPSLWLWFFSCHASWLTEFMYQGCCEGFECAQNAGHCPLRNALTLKCYSLALVLKFLLRMITRLFPKEEK